MHPYDFDADDSFGAAVKKEFIRFYEVTLNDFLQTLSLSTEITVHRSTSGEICGGYYKVRHRSGWIDQGVDSSKMYVLIRRRAEDKRLQEKGVKFIRWITYIMPLWEYNKYYKSMRAMTKYNLQIDTVILHYNWNGDNETSNDTQPHGNSKNGETFRPTMHSVKAQCKTKLIEDSRPPRFIADDFEQNEDIFNRRTDSSLPRNMRQIYNIKSKYANQTKKIDDITAILLEMLDQAENSEKCRSPIDASQPFVREFLYQSGGQPLIVLYLDQTLNDISRFCTRECKLTPSTLAFDTTFNIGEFKFTQTVYKNLSLLKKSTDSHPWFPGPVLIHRRERFEDYSYFWQSVCRAKPDLRHLSVIGSDECQALYDGILSETDGTVHLLGLEHVQKNVQEHLSNRNIPKIKQRVIVDDIFGEKGLINCNTGEEFDTMLKDLVGKWNGLEKEYSKNEASRTFAKYFQDNKADKMKTKMIKGVRNKVLLDGDYRQNCIEWAHYMSKSEIDAGVVGAHKKVSLTEAIDKLKQRYLRLYTESVKCIYGVGKYKLSPSFDHLSIPYDAWMNEDDEAEKIAIVKKFLDFRPSQVTEPESLQSNDISDKIDLCVEPQMPETSAKKTEISRKLPISVEAFTIPDTIIPPRSLIGIFNKAESLINIEGSVTKAASVEPNMRTVKSSIDPKPHIVQPKGKNKNFLECDCRLYKWYKICQHTLAASVDIGNCFEYLIEAKKKIMQGTPSLTDGINATRKISEKGMKLNEIRKAAIKNKKRNSTPPPRAQTQKQMQPNACEEQRDPVTCSTKQQTNDTQRSQQQTSSVQQQPQYAIPQMHSQDQYSTFYASQQHIFPQSQPAYMTQSQQQLLNQQQSFNHSQPVWNSGMSPHAYQLIKKPLKVTKCYGCGQEFAAKYNHAPNNLIIKHIDKRITGKDTQGMIVYNTDFTPAYYHANRAHISRKNPYFDGNVVIDGTLAQELGQDRLTLFTATTGLTVTTTMMF